MKFGLASKSAKAVARSLIATLLTGFLVTPAQADPAESCSAAVDIWFANDVTGSVTNSEFNSAKTFLANVGTSFYFNETDGFMAGVIDWAGTSTPSLRFAPTASFSTAIDGYTRAEISGGGTIPASAQTWINNNRLPPTNRDVPFVVVYLTDGDATTDIDDWIAPANAMRTNYPNSEIIVMVIAEGAVSWDDGDNAYARDLIAVAGSRDNVIVGSQSDVNGYADIAEPTNGYISTLASRICAVAETLDAGDSPPAFVEDSDHPGTLVGGAYAFTYDEGQAADAVLGAVAATDADGDDVTFAITAGNDDGWFQIDETTGAITLTAEGLAAAANDFEGTPNVWTLTVTAADGVNSTPVTVVLTETDVNENAPAFAEHADHDGSFTGGAYAFTYDEGQTAGAPLGMVAATDADGDDVTFTITAGNDDSWFQIDPATGAISLTAAGVLAAANDFETAANAWTLTVTASDGVNSTPVTVVLSEADVTLPGQVVANLGDADGDGVVDDLESDSADRDGDGIPDRQDYDPLGYFYCRADGRILTGGQVSVSGPGNVTMVRDGTASGEYQWFVDAPGTYVMAIDTSGMEFKTIARNSAGSVTLASLPGNPIVIGATEAGNSGVLGLFNGVAIDPEAPTAYYTTFVIAEGDANVLGNNIPFDGCEAGNVSIEAVSNGREPNGDVTTNGQFRVTLSRPAAVDTTVTYTVAGTATPGADYQPLTGTVVIPAGQTSALIDVIIREDSIADRDETVEITLTSVTGDSALALADTPSASIVIAEDLVDQIREQLADILQADLEQTVREQSRQFAELARGAGDRLRDRGAGTCSAEISTELAENPIAFDTGSAVIRPESEAVLARIEAVLQQCPDTRFEIGGHTDSDGSDAANIVLSEQRVQAVQAWLERHGVPVGQLTARGYGEAQPIADNATEEGRASNRRVVFTVVGGSDETLSEGADFCGTQTPFDVDGALAVDNGVLRTSGQFGEEAWDCVNGKRRLTWGSFAVTSDASIGTQGMLTFGVAKEKEGRDSIAGRFLGGYLSRNSVDATGATGDITGLGLNAGVYGAREIGGDMILDYYGAGAVGQHRFDLSFAPDIRADGHYSYAALFAGAALSGERKVDSFTLRPRAGIDLAYAVASDARVAASDIAVTDTGIIALDPATGLRAYVEGAFVFGDDPDSTGTYVTQGYEFTPRLFCDAGWSASANVCGYGLALSVARHNPVLSAGWSVALDHEARGDTQRTSLRIEGERQILDGVGVVSSGLQADVEGQPTANIGLSVNW